MSLPHPNNDDDNKRFSEKPLPPMTPASKNARLGDDVPKGEELFYYVLDCMNKGSNRTERRFARVILPVRYQALREFPAENPYLHAQ